MVAMSCSLVCSLVWRARGVIPVPPPPPPLEDPELVEGLPPPPEVGVGVGDGVGEGVGLGVGDGATLFKKSSTDQPSGAES